MHCKISTKSEKKVCFKKSQLNQPHKKKNQKEFYLLSSIFFTRKQCTRILRYENSNSFKISTNMLKLAEVPLWAKCIQPSRCSVSNHISSIAICLWQRSPRGPSLRYYFRCHSARCFDHARRRSNFFEKKFLNEI